MERVKLLLKYLVVISGILALFGCSTSLPDAKKSHATINVTDSTLVTLSHVKAYLLIGNVKQAQETFDTIDNSQAMPNTLLTLAELRAASGQAEGAQQAFLLALSNDQLDKKSVPVTLIDYFCSQKKWPALQGYASAVIASSSDSSDIKTQDTRPSAINIKNNALTQIGLCFFEAKRWNEAQKWLQQLDTTQQLDPQTYLALARIAVEQKQYSVAQESINQYETTKTKIDAKTLWTAFEVYRALKQTDTASQVGEILRSLYPTNKYTRKYILTKKRIERIKHKQQETMAVLQTNKSLPEENQLSSAPEKSFHIIKKGETLYQLSKRYEVTIADLLKWNPNLVVDDISLGTSIQISAN